MTPRDRHSPVGPADSGPQPRHRLHSTDYYVPSQREWADIMARLHDDLRRAQDRARQLTLMLWVALACGLVLAGLTVTLLVERQ